MTGAEAVLKPDGAREDRRSALLKLLLEQELRTQNPPPLTRCSRETGLVLSYSQQRLWFLCQIEGASEAYHIPLRWRLAGIVKVAALQRAFDRLVARHESLRTTFYMADGEVFQRVGPEGTGFMLRQKDLRGQPDAAALLSREIREESAAPFDLEHGPLIRGRLIRLADQEYALLVTMHHIVSDGWSMGIFARELSALYGAFAQNKDDPLLRPNLQYPDYAAWQRQWLSEEMLAGQSAYWKQALTGAPDVIELPLDHRRPAQQDFEGDAVHLKLDETLTQELKALSQRHNMTLFMTLLTGWALVLSRLSNQDDIVIGVPSANRRNMEVEGMIGFFVNTLAYRIDLSGAPSVSDLLERVKHVARAAQSHQDIPFEQVVELVKPARSMSHAPLFQIMFTWNNNEGGTPELAGLTTSKMGGGKPAAKFDMLLNLREEDGRIVGFVNYATALFERQTVERYAGYLREALAQMVKDARQSAAALDIIPTDERRKLLIDWNRTDEARTPCTRVHALFEEQVVRNPDAKALVHGDNTLSYGELNAQANRLAHHLIGLGVKPDSRVAISMERSAEMIIGLLAILKAGGAYVPLDPAYPAERLAYMLKDSAPVLVLTHGAARNSLTWVLDQAEGRAISLLDLDADAQSWATQPSTNPDVKDFSADHLAYIIYTSGSTGQPKGVAMPHGPLSNLIAWQLGENVAGCTLQFTSLSFDVSFQEIFSTLSSGQTLVIVPDEVRYNLGGYSKLLADYGVQNIFAPQVVLEQMAVNGGFPSTLKRFFQAGEALRISPAIADLFSKNPHVALYNHYGPSETHVATSLKVENFKQTSPSIGRPIGNTRIYLLDRLRNPVPEGAVGELYIGGACVARGYLNRPDLTEERFIESPFIPGERLYKTGDLGRYLPDGSIAFLGRNDSQVKIRGFRIELGEIEARLLRHTHINEAVVAAHQRENGGKLLVAYYVTRQSAGIQADDLRRHLSAALPDYMVPAAYIQLPAIPLTPSGKIDRRALPSPDDEAYGRSDSYEPPQGSRETALAHIWSEVLGIQRVGRHDNFFDLGGHSLLAVKVITRIRDVLGADANLRMLFEAPTLVELAEQLERLNSLQNTHPVIPCSRSSELVLSYSQQRLWFLCQIEGASEAYHIPLRWRLKGDLDEDALARALDRLFARHESLRTTFRAADGKLFQRVGSSAPGFPLRRQDFHRHSQADSLLAHEIAEESAAPFDLERGPLIRGRLIRVADDEHVLLVTMHHIVSDGWSMAIFARELSTLYCAFRQREDDPLVPLEIQYPDYAAWQRQWLSEEMLAGQSAYWKQALAGVPDVIELPLDHRRPAQQDFSGDNVHLKLDEALTQELKALSQRHNMTLFMTLMAGWALVLSRLSNQDDVVIGAPSANRRNLEVEGIIGFFVNTLAYRIDLSGGPSVSDLLERVKHTARNAQVHQDLPFEQVVDLVRPTRNMSHAPLFQVMFVWNNNEGNTPELPGLSITKLGGGKPTAKFDMLLNLREEGGRIVGFVNYATSCFERQTVERYAGYLREALSQIVKDERQSAAAVDILSETERHKLLFEWSSTQEALPPYEYVYTLFEQQALRNPNAKALAMGDQSLSYGELNAQANRLAHHLIGLGVQPESRVAISMERSPEMIVGLLAILKAGGAYVPIDPAYPAERLGHILKDSDPVLVLTHSAARDSVKTVIDQADISLPLLDLDADAQDWVMQSAVNPDAKCLTSDNLAYVIYTSGSTGQPKGVAMHHGPLSNLIAWQLGENVAGTTLQFTSLSFDVSFQEIFSTLSSGQTLVIVPDEVRYNLGGHAKLLASYGIENIFAPQVVLEQMAANGGFPPTLKRFFQAGEALRISPAIAELFGKNPHVALYNHYGPSETHVATSLKVDDFTQVSPSIGRPIGNARIYLLDKLRNPVPQGAVGELYIGGACVARGYLNRPDLTKDRFIESPFMPGERLYKTGDLGRYLPDGSIDFLGRNDSQVKIRGFRIELGEIEARLLSHGAICEAVVTARESDSGSKRLVAYYTSQERTDISADDLRRHLAQALPDYMVPAAYVRLDTLPLTPSGKIDRKSLPNPDEDAYQRTHYVPPIGSAETALTQIWQDILGIQNISRYDNFFDLGGHSLLAVRLLESMRPLGSEPISMKMIFETPTIEGLARRLGNDVGSPVEMEEGVI